MQILVDAVFTMPVHAASLDGASLYETLFRDWDLWGPSFSQGTLLVPSGVQRAEVHAGFLR